MPLFPPVTDTLRWDDLVREGRSLLPLVSPEWTDQNTSDPGIALLELLAWLVEADSYRSAAVSDRERRLLLALAGFAPAPARAPRCLVRATAGAPGTVAAGLTVDAVRGVDRVPLTLVEDVRVSGAEVAAVAWAAAGSEPAFITGCTELTREWAAGRVIEPLGPEPHADDALILGLRPLAGMGPAAGEALRCDLWFVADDGETASEVQGPPVHHTARVAWEAWGGAAWVAVDVDDATAALTKTGRVRVSWASPHVGLLGAQPGPDGEGTFAGSVAYWLRCRVTVAGHDAAPRLRGIHLDAAEAVAARTYAASGDDVVGIATGVPGEQMRLPHAWCDAPPVLTVDGASIVVVADLAQAGPAVPSCVLERDGVTLTFGDGRCGATLPPGGVVRVGGWWTSTAGELRPPVTTPAGLPGLQVVASLAPGVVAEDTAATAARAEAHLWVHDRLLDATHRRGVASLDDLPRATVLALGTPERAVTAQDAERVARATPGVSLARVRALPGVDPRLPGLVADGCLTVVVVPWLPLARPTPSRGAARTVLAQLNSGRTVGTRIFVSAPEYATIAVSATLALTRGARAATVARDAQALLLEFLHPITGGPDGRGWPFGRAVRRTEILQRLDGVAGVDHVDDLILAREGCRASCDDVALRPTELAVAGTIALTTAGGAS